MKANPVTISGLKHHGQRLSRIYATGGDDEKDEAWLQQLLYWQPELLPVDELEEGTGPLISLGREIPTETGSIDNLYISPRGDLTIVETKLWKNPEKHRAVVAQIIDYAKDLAKWDYEQLCTAVLNSDPQDGDKPLPPFEKVQQSHPGVSRHDFEERVTINLQQGRFILLIVGDRISPNVTLLAQAIHSAPGLAFTLGLVELQFYSLAPSKQWPLIVVPEIVGRTVEVTRGVVSVFYNNEKPRVEVRVADKDTSAAGSQDQLHLDETVFFAQLRKDLAEPYRTAMKEWTAIEGQLYFTPRHLSFMINRAGEDQLFVYCDPRELSVVRRSDFELLCQDEAIWKSYCERIGQSPKAASAVQRNKFYVDHDRLSPHDVHVILQSAIELAKAVKAQDKSSC